MITRLRERGFTLIESIVVMVTMAIAAVGIIFLNSNIFVGEESNKRLQVGVALMQECAEQLLSIRRSKGFGDTAISDTLDGAGVITVTASANATTACLSMTLPGFSAPTVEIAKGNDGTTATGNDGTIQTCPCSGANCCKLVTIRQGGLDPIRMVVVN